jgi:hypothetical protein
MSFEIAKAGYKCYFCPKTIIKDERYVEWLEKCCKDKSHRIRLHPKCAVMLASRLIGDAFEADCDVDNPEDLLRIIKDRIDYRRVKSYPWCERPR